MTTNRNILSGRRMANVLARGIILSGIAVFAAANYGMAAETANTNAMHNFYGPSDTEYSFGDMLSEEVIGAVTLAANEEYSLNGVSDTGRENVNKAVCFNMEKGQTLHVTYTEERQGAFIVGIVNEDGEVFTADTELKKSGDTASLEVPDTGTYYFYCKGLVANARDHSDSVNYCFDVYFE